MKNPEFNKILAEALAEFNKRTNADHIRAMTDEELAKFMNVHDCPPKGSICSHPYDMTRCDNCWLDWLKQEAIE